MRLKARGPTEIRTRIAGFKVQCANHYTMGPGTRWMFRHACLNDIISLAPAIALVRHSSLAARSSANQSQDMYLMTGPQNRTFVAHSHVLRKRQTCAEVDILR